jgi:hypothetical protein
MLPGRRVNLPSQRRERSEDRVIAAPVENRGRAPELSSYGLRANELYGASELAGGSYRTIQSDHRSRFLQGGRPFRVEAVRELRLDETKRKAARVLLPAS